jgi:hypothetical protein
MPNIGAVKSCFAPTYHVGGIQAGFHCLTGTAIVTQQRQAILVAPNNTHLRKTATKWPSYRIDC